MKLIRNWTLVYFGNLISVTLGNMVGALVFVVLLFWTTYLRDDHNAN